MDNFDKVKIAYKKLKSDLYFDKTQLPLRDEITFFEDNSLEDKINEICSALFLGEHWVDFENKILESVGTFVYPKKLNRFDSKTAIFNSDCTLIELREPQYFIDMSVQGHILSVLWVLSVGYAMDKNCDENNPNGMYEHSYGNRLRKTLFSPETQNFTYSPSLFERKRQALTRLAVFRRA